MAVLVDSICVLGDISSGYVIHVICASCGTLEINELVITYENTL